MKENHDLELGYRGASACAAAGISYRQLDYWARTGLVEQLLGERADQVALDFMDLRTFLFSRL